MFIPNKTLRPGFLVSLKTSIRGNVSYVRVVTESTHVTTDGEEREAWETKRTIADPKEHKRAKEARSKANSLIRSVCKQTAFGLLCPEVDADKLEEAIKRARAVVELFNSSSEVTRVSVAVLSGKISPNDVEAVRAINGEIRELLAEAASGVGNKDVDSIRDAAGRLKDIGEMLDVDARAKVQMAVETARTTATAIKKAGDQASVDSSAIKRITEIRAAFVDLSETAPVAKPKGKKAAKLQLEPTE